jgi:hypothetical protein
VGVNGLAELFDEGGGAGGCDTWGGETDGELGFEVGGPDDVLTREGGVAGCGEEVLEALGGDEVFLGGGVVG